MTTMVEIAGNRYEVRRRGESREIKVEGVWMDAVDFVNMIATAEENAELALFAVKKARRVKP